MALPIQDRPGVDAYLGLGSNLGDRRCFLRSAIQAISRQIRSPFTVASLYETSPVGPDYADQPAFLNSVVGVTTSLPAGELLDACMAIEADLGRLRTAASQARTVDIDVLLVGSVVIEEPDLIVPHPRMCERLFALTPLAEIAGRVVHPLLGVTVSELLTRARQTAQGQTIARVDGADWWRVDSG